MGEWDEKLSKISGLHRETEQMFQKSTNKIRDDKSTNFLHQQFMIIEIAYRAILIELDETKTNEQRQAAQASSFGVTPHEVTGGSAPKRRRNHRSETINHVCQSCFTTNSPAWRTGPQGPQTLCNRCGLRYSKMSKKGTKEESEGESPPPPQSYTISTPTQPQPTSAPTNPTLISQNHPREVTSPIPLYNIPSNIPTYFNASQPIPRSYDPGNYLIPSIHNLPGQNQVHTPSAFSLPIIPRHHYTPTILPPTVINLPPPQITTQELRRDDEQIASNHLNSRTANTTETKPIIFHEPDRVMEQYKAEM